MKRILENSALILLIAAGLWLDSIAITKGVAEIALSKFGVVAVEAVVSALWQRRLVFAIVVSILVASTVRIAAKRRVGIAALSIMAIIALAVIFEMMGTGYKTVIYALQDMIISSYVLICYGTLCALKARFPLGTKRNRKWITDVYLLIHIFFVVACSWWPLLHRFCIRPTTVIWMASDFMIAYWAVLWSDKDKEDKPLSRGRKIKISIDVVLVQTLVFSAQRIWEILLSFQNPAANIERHANWLVHRWRVFQALTTGNYFDGQMDPYVLVNFPTFHATWLGIAFERWQQSLYILIEICFLSLLTWMYRTHKRETLFRALALGVIICNVWGIICELNLFHSTPVSIMAAYPFQLIPLACLLCMNKGIKDGGIVHD